MSDVPSAQFQLSLFESNSRLFDEGEFIATYKFALLIALTELSIERGRDTDIALHLPLGSISENFIEITGNRLSLLNSLGNFPVFVKKRPSFSSNFYQFIDLTTLTDLIDWKSGC